MKYTLSLLLLIAAAITKGQTPCENGEADGYPCNQVSLYAHLAPTDLMAIEHNGYFLNDIWGWQDPETGKEYALVGVSNGVTFVDISNPSSPVVIGKLIEPEGAADARIADVQHEKSTWRDMKVYNNHIFVVSDANALHGMQIFDLTRLRDFDGTEKQAFEEDTNYPGINSAHNIVINEATGYAYIVGARDSDYCNAGGLHIVDINDPINPEYVACFDDDGYTHDAQCVIYQGPDTDYQGKEICFNSNEDTFTIVDVDDKENMSMISRTGYENVAYTHQGWLTEDHRFFLMNDELDELNFGHNAKTLIWNVEDLDNPVFTGHFYNEEKAIDHNLYTHNGLVYESNYFSGLRILDLERVAEGQLREVAFFDTYPQANDIHFGGSWSNYPYFESGTLVVSDMINGLFVLRLDLKDDPITLHPGNSELCEGSKQIFTLEVTEGNFSYQWQKYVEFDYADFTDSENVTGSISNELELVAVEELEQADIRCQVTDENGNIFYSYPARYTFSDVLPNPDFTYFFSDFTSTFTNISTHANTYQWDFGDGESSEEGNPAHTYTNPGTYEVTLTAFNECGKDSLKTSLTILVNKVKKHNDAFIFPNPSTGMITIENDAPATFILIDISGRTHIRKSLESGVNELDLTSIKKKGTYLIRLIFSSHAESHKLILR